MSQDENFRKAEQKIEQALNDNLVSLNLSGMGLTELPESLGQLQNLTTLFLYSNKLNAVQENIGKLQNLTTLLLNNNQLNAVPESIGKLQNLTRLDLNNNQLNAVPESIGKLQNLTTLFLNNNQLNAVPESIAKLQNLTRLDLYNNQLNAVPESIAKLQNLTKLDLGNNQLPDAMREAYEQRPLKEFLAYLRELGSAKGDERLYETKLVMVGEGEVGKSCLVTAMNDGKFNPKRPTTHGIEITTLELPHPNDEPDISVNCWDFGGQDVYRVTHQFFFSSRSLYVVVWHPRRGADNSRVEDWIELIQRRVGEGFRVLVVASHCDEGRYPRIDEHGLTQQFPGVIAGFYEIDSETGTGISELREAIAQEAAGLPQMGERFPVSWREVRDDIQRSKSPKLDWKSFEKKCRKYEVAKDSDKVLASLLDALGHIIYFGDDPSLADLVVLKPEWLSKAIGLVLEDRPTIQANGILDHSRLAEIWNDKKRKPRDRYTQDKLYPFFLRLMEKFDVSYRIPDSNDQTSLVGELVQEARPAVEGSESAASKAPEDADENGVERFLPWDHDHEARSGWHRLQLIVRLDDDPPGLIPWLIVRNHRYNDARIHWREGVFLESDYGQALIEMRDRELFLTVHGSYPSTFRGIMQSSVEELLKTWEGLKGRWHLRVPCQHRVDQTRCKGSFSLEALLEYLKDGDTHDRCEECRSKQDISKLVVGYPSFRTDERAREAKRQLDELAAKVHAGFAEAKDDRRELAADMLDRFRSMSAESARLILKALENRQSPCPRVFTLLPAKLDGWEKANPAEWLGKATKKRFRLSLWCEMPGHEHPTCPIGSAGSKSKPKDGEYVFSQPQDWFGTVARYTSLIGKVLGVVAPVAKNAAQLIGGDDDGLAEVLKQIDVMKSLGDAAKQMKADGHSDWYDAYDTRHEPFREIVEGAEHRVFLSLLRELDKSEHYGGLKWTLDKASGDWMWLCPQHFKIFNPDLPKLPPARRSEDS